MPSRSAATPPPSRTARIVLVMVEVLRQRGNRARPALRSRPEDRSKTARSGYWSPRLHRLYISDAAKQLLLSRIRRETDMRGTHLVAATSNRGSPPALYHGGASPAPTKESWTSYLLAN